MDKKRKKSAERIHDIVETARNILIQEGVQGITIKRLAAENDISEGAIYRHFKDKRSILFAVIDQFGKDLMLAFEKPKKVYDNPLQRLKAIMRTHMVFTEKKKPIIFSITAESIHFKDDALRRKVMEVIENYKTEVKKILNEAKRTGFARPDINVDVVSLAFFGLIQTAIIQYALTNYTVPPVSKFNASWNVFLKGIENKNDADGNTVLKEAKAIKSMGKSILTKKKFQK